MRHGSNTDIAKAAKLLKNVDNVEILMHRNPDGDTVGCAFALWAALDSLGKRVKVGCIDEIPTMYSYLTIVYDAMVKDFIPTTFITVDSATLSQLGDYRKFSETYFLNIDHHGDSNSLYAENNLVDDSYASCAEIVYEVIKEMGVSIDTFIASAIYTGVSTDTGCFKYRNTTSNSHLVTAELLKSGMDLAMLNRVLFESKTKEFLALQQMALSSLRFFFNDRIAVTTVTREMFIKAGANDEDMVNISPIAKAIQGVEVGLTFRETAKGTIKCSVRSSPAVDASSICKQFGGGGHHGSAAFEVTGDITDVETLAIKAVIAALEEQQ